MGYPEYSDDEVTLADVLDNDEPIEDDPDIPEINPYAVKRGYPDYPYNRLIVGGVDLSEEFKMVLADGYTLAPPSPKKYTVDIPGGNGVLDLTESMLGDVAYENREQKFTFYLINEYNFEASKTRISNFLHGKSFDYQMTMDPDYTYHGRFSVDTYKHKMFPSGKLGTIEVSVSANPYKIKNQQVYVADGVGGIQLKLQSGRMPVSPIVETSGNTKLIYNNKLLKVQQGTYKLTEFIMKQGLNGLYISTYDIRNITWETLKNNPVTWGNFGKKCLYEWYKTKNDGSADTVMNTWGDVMDETWADYEDKTWLNLAYRIETIAIVKEVYVKYDWGDL